MTYISFEKFYQALDISDGKKIQSGLHCVFCEKLKINKRNYHSYINRIDAFFKKYDFHVQWRAGGFETFIALQKNQYSREDAIKLFYWVYCNHPDYSLPIEISVWKKSLENHIRDHEKKLASLNKTRGTKPVADQPPSELKDIHAIKSDVADEEPLLHDWQEVGYTWEFKQIESKPFNRQMASFELASLEAPATQSPLNIIPSIFISSVYEHERGFILNFKTMRISVELDDYKYNPAFIDRNDYNVNLEVENWSDTSIEVVSRHDSEILVIKATKGYLDGQYNMTQNTLFPVFPQKEEVEFSAKMRVRPNPDNLVCPAEQEVTDEAKRVIITQMIAKSYLPAFSNENDLILQETTYAVKAQKRM